MVTIEGLDENLAIRYSEKIFNNTANLYILNLGQIFFLLKDFQINHLVIRKDDQTIIEIKIDSVISKQNDINAQQARCLYMATLTDKNSVQYLKSLYDRLVNNFKPKKIAIVACM